MKIAYPLLITVFWLLLLITAPVSATTYTLVIQTNGSGTVSANPTNSVYPAGSVVTLSALPGDGWYFSNWTGDENSTANPLNVTMTSNKVVVANFHLIPNYVLITSTNGMGSVSLTPPGGSYLSNSVVNALASAAAGWVFVSWTGDASGSTNPVAVTMNSNKGVTANFAQPAAIDIGPLNANADIGATVTFTTHAIGTPVLTYQWWFNGARLDGATDPILMLSNVQPNQEGTYSITVSNAYGMSSNSAVLSLNNACTGTNVVRAASETELRSALLAP